MGDPSGGVAVSKFGSVDFLTNSNLCFRAFYGMILKSYFGMTDMVYVEGLQNENNEKNDRHRFDAGTGIVFGCLW